MKIFERKIQDRATAKINNPRVLLGSPKINLLPDYNDQMQFVVEGKAIPWGLKVLNFMLSGRSYSRF